MYVDNYGPRCVLAPVRCLRSTPRPTSSSARAYLFWNLQKRALGSTRSCFPFRPLSFFRSKSFRSVLAFAGVKRPPHFSMPFSIFYTLFANCMMNVVCIFFLFTRFAVVFVPESFVFYSPITIRIRCYGFFPSDKLCTMKIRLRWFTTTTTAEAEAAAAVETFAVFFWLFFFPSCKTSFGWPRRRFSRDRNRFIESD